MSWQLVSQISGWIFVIVWGMVSYPQIILNYKLKSVEGFKLDYPFLNLFGFIFYTITCSVGYFNGKLPFKNYGLGEIQIQDLIFAIHGVFISLVFNSQALIYKRGKNTISSVAISMAIFGVISSIIYYYFSEVAHFIPISKHFNILKYVGYQKLAVTLYKYAPLAYWNYKRKSTQGFSIYSFLLDLTGGFFSLSQLFIDYYTGKTDELNSIKLLLGFTCIFYDLLLIYQHYVLYGKNRASVKDEEAGLNAKLVGYDEKTTLENDTTRL